MRRVLLIGPLSLLAAMLLLSGCTDNPTGSTTGSHLAFDIRVESPKLLQQLPSESIIVQLTVTAADMDPVLSVDTVSSTGTFELTADVPAGRARQFVLDIYEYTPIPQAAQQVDARLLYRGIRIQDVFAGIGTTVPITLLPQVPMLKLTPKSTVVVSGQPFEVEIKAYNMPGLLAADVFIAIPDYYTYQYRYVEPASAEPPAWLRDGLFYEANLSAGEGSDCLRIRVGDSSNFLPFPMTGNYTSLGTIQFTTAATTDLEIPLIELLISDSTTPYYCGWSDVLVFGNADVMSELFLESADIQLTPLADRIITFPDTALQAEVARSLYRIPDTTIHLRDALLLNSLYLVESNVTDLTGIGQVKNLEYFEIGYNNLTSIAPLADLTNLYELRVMGTAVSNIEALTNLRRLNRIDLSSNSISNLAPLAKLTELWWVNLNDNQIVDLAPLEGLTDLYRLYLSNNLITDLAPLVANPGLGIYDSVYVSGNPLSTVARELQITQLQTRGVGVAP